MTLTDPAQADDSLGKIVIGDTVATSRGTEHLQHGRWAIGALAALLISAPSVAVVTEVRVTSAGLPVEGAVVSLHSPSAAARVVATNREMDQRDFAFVPRVLPVTVGSMVNFPNSDNILHHVYSFSPARTFELPLYSGRAASPVRFDLPGVVVLGCNIHDPMVGFIIVLDTPHHGLTDSGGVVSIDAPPGDYVLQTWHERLPRPDQPDRREITLLDQGDVHVIDVGQAPAPVPAAPSPSADDRLQDALQRFRALRNAPVEGDDTP